LSARLVCLRCAMLPPLSRLWRRPPPQAPCSPLPPRSGPSSSLLLLPPLLLLPRYLSCLLSFPAAPLARKCR
jgi:hypothetical protein